MCTEATIKMDGRRFTNHSGKVYNTCAAQLYESETFDEQTIMSRIGHRGNAPRTYKRASSTLVKAGSDALQPAIGEPEYKILKVDKKFKEETANESSATTSLVIKDVAY